MVMSLRQALRELRAALHVFGNDFGLTPNDCDAVLLEGVSWACGCDDPNWQIQFYCQQVVDAKGYMEAFEEMQQAMDNVVEQRIAADYGVC